MGAQSTGKSYLLNRLFGTRFTVASCRTTIGIWMSLVKI
jgi:predicted GTPase